MIKVYGDIMLDRWISGKADRVSPEADVLILNEHHQTFNLGGAANLAINLKNIDVDTELYGVVGKDTQGIHVLHLLGKTDIISNLSSLDKPYRTTIKTRLVGDSGQHLLRWDRETKYTGKEALKRLSESLSNNDIVVISDYNKGTVTEETVEELLGTADIKVFVDPKQDASYYDGAFLVKPNMKEYEEWNGKYNKTHALEYMRDHNWTWLVVTDGANGIHVLNKDSEYHYFKEDIKEVSDVTGAGDIVLAVIVYAYNKGLSIPYACELASYAATRSVEKRGVVPVTLDDLDRGIVWTNGVFDILHTGHLKLLRHAHTLGKRLVVGINSDKSVKRLKGETRPINNEIKRKETLEELGFIDKVIIFDEDTPIDTIKKVKPDIIVKGGDYTVETTVGNDIAKVVIFPKVEGHSTTELIKKISITMPEKE